MTEGQEASKYQMKQELLVVTNNTWKSFMKKKQRASYIKL